MKTKSVIFWALILGTIFLLGYQCTKIKDLKSEMKMISQKTDTVRIPVPYKIPEPYFDELNPSIVTIYKKDTTSNYSNFEIRDQGLMLLGKKDSVFIPKNYFTTFVLHDKLLHLNLTQNNLSLSTLSIDGITRTRTYGINLAEYNYSYINSLTYKKVNRWKFNLRPAVEYTFRPLNNLHDLDIMFKFKTGNFNYKLGLNGFYYPQLKTNPGWDVKVGISYNF